MKPTRANAISGDPVMIKSFAVARAIVAGALGPASAADAAHPTVVELFQSQGCSSCPPANANVLALSNRPDILALSFQVTYWDQLGWKDTFAQPKFTDRQWDYARAFGRKEVFTPQVVVNGRADTVGVRPGQIEQVIAKADRGAAGPRLDIEGGKVVVSAGRGAGEVWLVRYDPRVVQVSIRRGENTGRTLPHKNVVKELVKLGSWSGGAETSRFRPAPANSRRPSCSSRDPAAPSSRPRAPESLRGRSLGRLSRQIAGIEPGQGPQGAGANDR